MVHVHQKLIFQAKQTSCDKPQTFLTRARVLFSLVWITKAFNLEWLLNLWERGKPQNKPSKKGLWRNWKKLTFKTPEEVGKNKLQSVDVDSPN
jgi:hypothetical protein